MTQYLLIVGAQRCGTTYLYQVLDEHPEIRMAKPVRPEPRFLLDEAKNRGGLAWFEAKYFGAGDSAPVHGEKSTSYLEFERAAERAAALMPAAVVLVMLRDPIDRAVSNWRFSTASGLEDRPLDQALEENLEGPRAWDPSRSSVSPYAYLERGRYFDYLEPWRRRFPRGLRVLFLDEYVGSADAIAREYAAIGVDPTFEPPSLNSRVNVAEGRTPRLDPHLTGRLRAYFVQSDARLRRTLNRGLPWDPRN